MVSPQARREAVKVFRAAAECSERHACGRLEVLRAMLRYRPRGRRALPKPTSDCACDCVNWPKVVVAGDIDGCTYCYDGKAG